MTAHFIISLTRLLQGALKVTFWVPFDPEERSKLLDSLKEPKEEEMQLKPTAITVSDDADKLV